MPSAVAHHTTAIEVGNVFSRVSPKLGVITHLIADISSADVEARIRSAYDGRFAIGVDLMSFDIDDAVRINVR